jgi:hypothetical protein
MNEDHLDKIRLDAQYLRESLRICQDRSNRLEAENQYLRNQVDTLLQIVANNKPEGGNH